MAADRTEADNVASDHPQLVSELKDKWNEWAKKTDVKRKK
jgi:hypothetical protein